MLRRILFTIGMVAILLTNSSAGFARKPSPDQPQKPDLPEHIPGEVLISFNPGVNSAQKMNEHGLEHKKEIQPLGVHLVKLPPGLSVEKALERFDKMPGVSFVEPNYVYQVMAMTQEEITDQWGLAKINAELAWGELPPEGRNPILLATVDTGIDRFHNDLSANIWGNPVDIDINDTDEDGNGFIDDWWGWDFYNNDNDPFDDNMHGTGVSSVMVGVQDGAGVAGVCPWCHVMAVKVLGADGAGSLDIVAEGINYAAAMGAKVINLSLTGPHGDTMELAVDNAWNSGAVVVAAAGNHGLNATYYPSGYTNAMGIASTDENDLHSCFSNHAENSISVSAPGERILMAEPDQNYGVWSGTSLSSPHVAGLAGLVLSQDPLRTNAEVRSLIETSADDLGPPGVDAAFGYGRINAYRALGYGPPSAIPADGLSSISDTATGYAHARKLVRDDTGTLHMIWHTKQEGPTYRIRYANSTNDGASWNLMPDAYSSSNETYHPALATDGVYLFAAIPSKTGPEAEAYYQIMFTRKLLPDGDWESAIPLMGGTYHTVRPDMYLDPSNGRLHVLASSLDHVPESTSDLYYRASNDQGATWDDLRVFSPSNSTPKTRYASLHANGDNVYVVARTVESFLGIFTYYYMHTVHSTDGGVTWIDQTQISSFLAVSSGEYGISLAGVGDRAYMGYEVGGNLYFRYNDGTGWSNYLELELSSSETDPLNPLNSITYRYKWPTITQAEDGQAWLIFEEHKESSLYGVQYKQQFMRHYDGNTWGEKESKGAGSTYANFKLGTEAGKIEWLQTGCNGSPFNLIYGSQSVGANNPPVADDQDVVTDEDTPVDITLTGSDLDGDDLTFSVVSGPANGVLSGTAPDLTYTPGPDFNGPDSFTFVANDGAEDSLPGTVSITINSVNDVPEADFHAFPTSGAAPLTVNFSDLSTGDITSWLWNFGDGGSSTLQDPSYEYTSSDIYTVSLTVFGPAGDATETKIDYITVTGLPDLIFEDGFEAGNTSLWDSVIFSGLNSLSVSTDASLAGTNFGLEAVINDQTRMYVRDDSPDAEPHYRARFYFDPNSMSMANRDNHGILRAVEGSNATKFYMTFRRFGGSYQIIVKVKDELLGWRGTRAYSISDAPHYFEIEWLAGEGSGFLKLWIDGTLKQTVSDLNNASQRIDSVFLGPWTGLDPGTSGTYFFDAFESRRESYIGLEGLVADFSADVISGPPPLTVQFSDLSVSSETITDYAWDFGDTNTSTESEPEHTYMSEGNFTVTLTVTAGIYEETITKVAFIQVIDGIFSDGFESGDLSKWSFAVTGGGDLSVSSGDSAMLGTYGLQAVINDLSKMYVRDDSPEDESHYRARFYFDPNSIMMAKRDNHGILRAVDGTNASSFYTTFRYFGSSYQVYVKAMDELIGWRGTRAYSISDDPHYIEIEWLSGDGSGLLNLWIDGALKQTVGSLHNDSQRIDAVYLGPWTGIDTGTSGSYFFDAFESGRENYIGP